MHEAGSSGRYDRMTWDGERREVVFQSKTGSDRLVIDTTSEPPRKRIERSGLSISSTITPPSEEDIERRSIENRIKRERSDQEGKMDAVWTHRRDEYTKRDAQ